jgi:hypothetical protein
MIHAGYMPTPPYSTTLSRAASPAPYFVGRKKIFATHVQPDELDGMAAVQELSA